MFSIESIKNMILEELSNDPEFRRKFVYEMRHELRFLMKEITQK